MSIPKRMTVNCSKCGKPFDVTVFDSVNSDYAEDIAMQIMSGKLFDAECPHCKFVSHLTYDVLYHDLRHGAMVWVVIEKSSNYMNRINEIRTTPKIPYKTLRIVNNMNALKEKVSCLEKNRDDKIIEMCKVFTANNALSQRPDFDFDVAFYTAVSGEELIYLFDKDGNNLCCELSDKLYDYLKELYYGSCYAEQFDENYPIVDYKWAEDILMPLIESEAEKLDSDEEFESVADNTDNADNVVPDNSLSINGYVVCSKCNANIPNDSLFCPGCGTRISAVEDQITIHQKDSEESDNNQKNEKKLAILKRIAVTEATKKKKRLIKIIIICVVAVLFTVGIIGAAIDNARNSELRNFATETMNDDYTNVYADVVLVEPEYFIYTSNGTTYREITEVVCKCKTVEGKNVWIVFFSWEYPGGSTLNEDSYETLTYSKSNPARITGYVTTARSVIKELENSIGNVFVLRMENMQK